MSEGDKSNRNVVSPCHSHVVWCPQYRRKLLLAPIKERLNQILRAGCEEHQAEIEAREVMPDHVRLLVGCDPQFGIHRLIKCVKGATSHQLRQEFPHLKRKLPSLWTNSYYVGSTGGVTIETVRKYVESQKGK